MTSPRVEAIFLAYLARVASWLDAAPLDDPLHAAAPLDRRQVAYLDGLGLPPSAFLVDGDAAGWPLMQARVERVGRLFRFATEPGEGVPAVIAVARDAAGRGDEMVAWSAREGWAASETNALALLGREWISPLGDEAVDVHAGVLEWLRAGRRGCVVMDRGRAVPVLREARAITVADLEAGEKLQRALTIRAPRIGIREAA